MSYDPLLAERLRSVVGTEPGVVEKRMFGGVAFLVGGHLAVCAGSHGGLMVRVDPGDTAELVAAPHVRRFEMRGREMDGWLDVGTGAVADDEALRGWAARGLAYARSLPPR